MFTTPSRMVMPGTSGHRPRSTTPLATSPTPSIAASDSRRRRLTAASSGTRGSTFRSSRLAPPAHDDLSIVQSQLSTAPTQLEEGTTLLRDDIMAVTAYSRLPTQVLDELQGVDFYIDAFRGAMDVTTGYAYVVSRTMCFVWSYASRATLSPTCFTFAMPETSSSSMQSANDLALCGLVAKSSGREPGLVLVTPSGQVCFWQGLSREDQAQIIQTPLNAGENITEMERLDPSAFVIATSQARMLKISLVSRAGRLQAELVPFSQPKGFLGRIFGSGASMGMASEPIVSIAVGPMKQNQAGRDVYAIGHKTVQKWRVVEGNGEKLITETDVQQIIASNVLQANHERFSAAESLAFQLVDGSVQNDGRLVILYSQTKATSSPLSYGLATLEFIKDATSFVVTNITPLKYTAFNDPRPYATPRLELSYGGPAAFISFADTVVLKMLEQGSQYFEEIVKLRDVARNRFIGTGTDPSDPEGVAPIATLSLITASSGSLLIEMATDQLGSLCTHPSDTDRQKTKTDRLKIKIEQALYFSEPFNPLSFELATDVNGTLIVACEELSNEILASSNSAAAGTVDLRISLKERLGKLKCLIQFVLDSGHLCKLSQTCRRRLCSDAQLAAAANDLWLYQNEVMGRAHSASPLAESIERVMAENGYGYAEDTVRLFFRHHLQKITMIFDQLVKRIKAVSVESLSVRSIEIAETNRVALAAFQAATRYVKEHGHIYGVSDSIASYEPWSAKPISIELLETLFSTTNQLIPERTRELGSTIDAAPHEYLSTDSPAHLQAELKSHLCVLAELTLSAYEERISYLRSDSSLERERTVLESVYQARRGWFIHPLIGIGRTERAFALAEQHEDFKTLTELCRTNPSRIDHYLTKYSKDFAFELYAFYVANGQQRKLLTQQDKYAQLVTLFLGQGENDGIAWLHELGQGRFRQACGVLESVSEVETRRGEKKIKLSLAKLAYIADLTTDQLATVGEQRRIEEIDDQIDLLAVHSRLSSLVDNTLETESADVVDSLAMRLAEFPAYRLHFITLVKRLQLGQVLSSEDLVDLLTLKDCPEEELNNFSTAIEVVVRARDVPEERNECLVRAIWRRVILRDDWASLSDTNNLSDEAVLHALKGTALFHTLQSVCSHESAFSTFRQLEDTIVATSPEVISARFPNQPIDLLNDEAHEIHLVKSLLEDTDLSRLFSEVAKMAQNTDDDQSILSA